MAYKLTTGFPGVDFSSNSISAIYRDICVNYDLPVGDVKNVSKEIEGHTGLLLQSGFERFEFAHKSLREFLSAEYLVRLPFIPKYPEILLRLPNELAIAVTISSNPSLYFIELVFERFTKLRAPSSYFTSFVSRLLGERPDFNEDKEVTAALLVLYTLTLRGQDFESRQQDLFLYDSLISEFERLLSAILERNDDWSILDRYYNNGAANVASDTKVFRFLRKKKNRILGRLLPNELLIRESFLVENLRNAPNSLNPIKDCNS